MTTMYLLGSVIITSVGQLLIKAGIRTHKPAAPRASAIVGSMLSFLCTPAILGGLSLYVVATILWLLALTTVDVSYAFPFVSVSTVLTVGGASIFFGEALSTYRVIGIGLICIGVCVIAIS